MKLPPVSTRVLFAIRGIAALSFGIAALLLGPSSNPAALVLLFGLYALFDGVVTLAVGSQHVAQDHAWLVLLEGSAGLGLGLAIFVWIQAAPGVLTGLIAWWAIATGVLDLVAAFKLWAEFLGGPLLAFGGAASVALGFALFFWPSTGAKTLTAFVGWYATVFGLSMFGHVFRMRRGGEPDRRLGPKTRTRLTARP
jgi:uncharacterized membrane protein HdeD (DUF308 family)